MPILETDIKLLKSARMTDTPDGGGRMTAEVVQSGVDNNIFDDVSNLDRVYGNVSLRKIFGAVLTNDTDKYLGSRVFIDKPPADENIHGLIFDASGLFDTRTQTSVKVESYLAPGGFYQGLLYGNHLAGMSTVMLIQQEDRVLPTVGQVLLLRKNEGLVAEYDQYVKITAVSSAVQNFTDGAGDFQRRVVTLSISDSLREAFPGFQASRIDADPDFTGKTRTFETVVADASQYYGIRPLDEAAAVGDFSIKADTAYSPLLPSAQIETPIADARSNGLADALVQAGVTLVQSFLLNFSTTQRLFIGGAVLPGSLTITDGAVVLTDDGGVLKNGGSDVGAIDYENGIASLSVNVMGTNTLTVTYTPAAVAPFVSQSTGIGIGLENRALSYVRTLGTLPAPGSLSVSYLVSGRWYVLRDNGTGGVVGATSALGAGSINYTTGTLAVTLGALPDVGSIVVIQWAESQTTAQTSNAELLNGGRLYVAINSDGLLSESPGTEAFAPNGVSITWSDATGARTSTDNGSGVMTGDATGTVNYAQGVVLLSPNNLPPLGTVFTLTNNVFDISGTQPTITEVGGNIGAGVKPFSISFTLTIVSTFTSPGGRISISPSDPGTQHVGTRNVLVKDDGIGGLFFDDGRNGRQVIGTVDYTSGVVTIPGALTSEGGYEDFYDVYVWGWVY